MAVGDHQMALARAQRQFGQQGGQGHATGNQHRPGQRLPIIQTHAADLQLLDLAAGEQVRACGASQAHQMPRHPRRIHHCLVRHAHATRQAGHQVWFQRVELRGVDRFGTQAGGGQPRNLGRHRCQFARIAGHPQRAAPAEFGLAQLGKPLPQAQRIRR